MDIACSESLITDGPDEVKYDQGRDIDEVIVEVMI